MKYYLQLMRVDKPVGVFLLAWPAYHALFLSALVYPSWLNIGIVGCGVWLMRSAGCVINDYFDRSIDGRVQRTKMRPLVTGNVVPLQALGLFCLLLLSAFLLYLLLPFCSKIWALAAVALVIIYPLSKRFFYLPQLVLGLVFSMSIPIVWLLESAQLSSTAYVLMVAVIVDALVYDTFYALQDYKDDQSLKIYSSAKLFGKYALQIVLVLQWVWVFLYALIGYLEGISGFFYGLLGGGALYLGCCWYQAFRYQRYGFAFYHHHWVGLGLLISFLVSKLSI